MPEKIFCIGFHRTGTRSLNDYLDRLGFKSIHWVREVDGIHYESLVIPHLDDVSSILDVLEPVIDSYQAFSDVPFPALYPELDRRHADSKFILVTRDLDKWWASLVNHKNLYNNIFSILDPFEYIQYNKYSNTKIMYFTASDKDTFTNIHKRHMQCATDYFSGRPEHFLRVDIEDPDIGTKISKFLGKSCDQPFPHLGKT